MNSFIGKIVTKHSQWLLILLWIIFNFSFTISAQHVSNLHDQYQFKSLTIDEGLTSNRVKALAQDHDGFIWMGTKNGLCRYDGSKIKQYLDFFIAGAPPEKIQDTRVALCDTYGNLWFGGTFGIIKYNKILDRFDEVVLSKDPDKHHCFGIAQDRDSTLWFSQGNRIVNFNIRTEVKTEYKYDSENKSSLPSESVEKLMVDREGIIWLATRGDGLIRFDNPAKNFTQFKANGGPDDIAENIVEEVYQDTVSGTIWATHNNEGISRFDRNTQTFKKFFPDPLLKPSGRVRGILKDPLGNFWIGAQTGLYLFDEINGTFLLYASVEHPKSRLSHRSIQTIMLDDQMGLWLGTHAGGVSFTNLNTSGFTKYEYSNIPNEYFLSDKNVYALAVDKNENVWIGTESGGLNYLDRKTGKFKYYTFNPNDKHSLPSNNIKAILLEDNDNAWIGSYQGGVSHFDSKTQSFLNFEADKDDPKKLHANTVHALAADPLYKNFVWVGTDKGLSLFNTSSGVFTRMQTGALKDMSIPEKMATDNTFSITKIDDHRIAFGLTSGLYILDHLANKVIVFEKAKDVKLNSIPFLLVDRKGALWFSAQENLCRMNVQDTSFIIFSKKQNLPETQFMCAADDADGNLWLSSISGVYKFDKLVNQQDTLIMHSFNRFDNLQSIEFLYGSSAMSDQGEIFFGGINGFNSFYPKNVKINPFRPYVHITELLVDNNKVAVGEKYFNDVLLDKSIIDTDYIRLYYKTKSFGFKFNALHYSAPESNQLAYKMDGYDEDWTYLEGSEGVAIYTNMPPGNYTFKVKAANNNGLWNEVPDVVEIYIPTPFHRTIWFYLVVVVALAASIYWGIKARERKLKQDKKLLQQAIDERTKEVDAVRQEILMKDEANRIRNWLNAKVKDFGALTNRSKEDIATFGATTLRFLTGATDAQIGAIILLNDSNPDDVFLEIVSTYGYAKSQNEIRIELLQGLVGACFSKSERLVIDNVPENYVKISSGLGEAKPKHLLMTPIKIEGNMLGVLEIASLNGFLSYHIELIETIAESMASTLFIIKSNDVAKLLLEQNRHQTEELRAQEEEMRQNMEELEATSESYRRRELELEARINNLMKGKTD